MPIPIETLLKNALREFETHQKSLLVERNVDARLRGARQFVDFLLRGPVRQKHERVLK